MLLSGMLDGTVEGITWHYEEGFKPRCPKANDYFWNPALSWKNKYKNGDPQQGPLSFSEVQMLLCIPMMHTTCCAVQAAQSMEWPLLIT